MIELLMFRLRPGADEAGFLEADRRVQTDFAYQQPGLLRRTTARGSGGDWVVIDLWRSAADADACDARWPSDPVAADFMTFVDPATVQTKRYVPFD
jgi:hypothetical protein